MFCAATGPDNELARGIMRVAKIVTITIGNHRRCLLICAALRRSEEEEWPCAPYEVYMQTEAGRELVFLGLGVIEAENHHFIAKTGRSWWWNCFIVNFV